MSKLPSNQLPEGYRIRWCKNSEAWEVLHLEDSEWLVIAFFAKPGTARNYIKKHANWEGGQLVGAGYGKNRHPAKD